MRQILRITQDGRLFDVDIEWTGQLNISENNFGMIQLDAKDTFKCYSIKFGEEQCTLQDIIQPRQPNQNGSNQ